ncbi:MAG: hypothetical protein DI601_19735 [Azospirillum brasilense]|uniref:hypothetical protein n=1 Tax=Roseomonas mucosa TaxID=207340 RepID=UPI000DB7C4BC|nr:hypothetical protein [Roseomonas mucosa]PZP41927.1 MAG: hypothetical protein DI601_19735 [Azospirillum brasilense]QDD97053.1 hypothetical protein ADP8_05094 [Roseomonas mucosa]
MTSAAREAIAQAAGNIPSPAPVEDAGAAIRAAQADLERAVAKASLQNDPMRHAFAGLSAALGAFAAGIEAVRRPLDPAAQAELVCKASAAAADGARREAGRLALGINRRFAFGAGLGVALLVLGAAGGGYAWGRAEEAARTRDAAGALAAALRDGSASARAWLGLMENNDVQAALRRCEGRTVWTDATGRRACVVPLWLDPPSSVVPATPGPS